MINEIQPTVSVNESSLDQLKYENKKERFNLFAEQFKSEFNSHKESHSSAASESDKEAKTKTGENNKIKADLSELGEKLKDVLKNADNFLEFIFDKDTNRMILRLIDSETKEVIQQFPPEMALKIARIINQLEGSGQIANATV